MKIKKIGIIGAGNMGSGIAQKIAQEGFDVILVDINNKFVQKGLDNIKRTLLKAVERKIFSGEQIKQILNHIKGSTSIVEVKDTDIVIEAVFEDIKIKRDLFKNLDEICNEKTILASNTSSFSITDLASSVKRKNQFIGLHFFYHPAMNRLLEIIPGRYTNQVTLDISNIFSHMIGKTAIHVKDSPGFAVNRFFVPWLNEATRIFEEGLANIPTIDDIAKKIFKVPMGPFELMNVTGPTIAYHSCLGLGDKLGEFYLPSNCLKNQIDKGELWNLNGEIDESNLVVVEERLLGTVFMVSNALLQENITSIEDIDRGAKVGLRWSIGPFEMMNKYGIERSYEIVEKFLRKYPKINIPSVLKQQYEKKVNWSFNFVDLIIKDDIANIIINRPEAMNAINEKVIQQIDKQFTKANNDPKVKGIVFEGAGKAFIAGADIQYFIKKIKENKIQDICRFTRNGHNVLNKIDNSEKIIITKLDGLALGGGAEIALSADTIIATDKGCIGFPETGIGIYPGLGGTQRITHYIGKELAKYLIFTGEILDAKTAKSIGLIEYVVPPDEIDDKIFELINSGKIIKKSMKGEIILPDNFQKIKNYFSDNNVQNILSGRGDLNELGQKISKTISYKAPLAIEISNKIIDEGSQVNLSEGLEIELSHLEEIFSTEDALEGLNSVIMRKRPVFKGK